MKLKYEIQNFSQTPPTIKLKLDVEAKRIRFERKKEGKYLTNER